MHKIKIIEATLLTLLCSICVCSSEKWTFKGMTTKNANLTSKDLSSQDSNQQRIYEFLENIRQKVTEMPVYEDRPQTDSSKQDLDKTKSFQSNKDQQAFDEQTPKRTVLNQQNYQDPVFIKRVITDFIPIVNNKDDIQNTKAASQQDLQMVYVQGNPSNRINNINKQESFVNMPIGKDHTQTTYTFEKSMSDLLRPMLHDPSVLTHIKSDIDESRILKTSMDKPAILERILVSHKSQEAGVDEPRPESIDKRRSLLNQQQQQTNLPQALPWVQEVRSQRVGDLSHANSAFLYSQSPYNMGKQQVQSEPNHQGNEPKYGERLRKPSENPESLKYDQNWRGLHKMNDGAENYVRREGQYALKGLYQEDMQKGSHEEYRRQLIRDKFLKQMQEQKWNQQQEFRETPIRHSDPVQERQQDHNEINNKYSDNQGGISSGEVVTCVHQLRQQRLQQMQEQKRQQQLNNLQHNRMLNEENHRQGLSHQIPQYIDRRALIPPGQWNRQHGQHIPGPVWSAPQPQYQSQQESHQRAEPMPQPQAQVQSQFPSQNHEIRGQSLNSPRDRQLLIYQRVDVPSSAPHSQSFLIESQQTPNGQMGNNRWIPREGTPNHFEKRKLSVNEQDPIESPIDVSASFSSN